MSKEFPKSSLADEFPYLLIVDLFGTGGDAFVYATSLKIGVSNGEDPQLAPGVIVGMTMPGTDPGLYMAFTPDELDSLAAELRDAATILRKAAS